jgi:hypothetical protein
MAFMRRKRRKDGLLPRANPSNPWAPSSKPKNLCESRQNASDREAWRDRVGSKIVEFAWERFCGSIVEQVRICRASSFDWDAFRFR